MENEIEKLMKDFSNNLDKIADLVNAHKFSDSQIEELATKLDNFNDKI